MKSRNDNKIKKQIAVLHNLCFYFFAFDTSVINQVMALFLFFKNKIKMHPLIKQMTSALFLVLGGKEEKRVFLSHVQGRLMSLSRHTDLCCSTHGRHHKLSHQFSPIGCGMSWLTRFVQKCTCLCLLCLQICSGGGGVASLCLSLCRCSLFAAGLVCLPRSGQNVSKQQKERPLAAH